MTNIVPLLLAIQVSICLCAAEWIEIATEAVNNAGTDKWRFLDFGSEIYSQYNDIEAYKLEWGTNYDNFVVFELANGNPIPDHHIFENTPESVNQDIKINILESNVAGLPVASDQYFCKACAKESHGYKFGDTCWGILDKSDRQRSCGCNSGGWNGNGAYYGGYESGQCNKCSCWGGAWAGYKTSGQQKGKISSTGLRLSIKASTNFVEYGCYGDNATPRAMIMQQNPETNNDRGWTMGKCAVQCASYDYFALQDGGDSGGPHCFCSSDQSSITKYGISTACRNGEGGPWANDVYKYSNSVCKYDTFEPQPCIVSGDPHFTIWNGNKHDFQGQPTQIVNGVIRDQFYYLHPCCGSSRTDMPISILGRHVPYGNSRVSGLDYLTIKLYEGETENDVYYVWFSSSIHGYIHKNEATSTLWDENKSNAGYNVISEGTDTISSKFKIEYTQTDSRTINVKIIIGGRCDVDFYMRGTHNYLDNRYKMHYLRLNPPQCYQCHTCGLCGDFEFDTTGAYWEDLKTIDGGVKSYRQGYGTEAFDTMGLSWEHQNVQDNGNFWSSGGDCSATATTTDTTSGTSAAGLCDSTAQAAAVSQCQAARDDNSACCTKIGGTFCINLQTGCAVDSCIMANGDVDALPQIVADMFTGPVTAECAEDPVFPPAPPSYSIDECAAGTDECDESHGICTDTASGYTCDCEAGYDGDGVLCTDEDECATGTHNCDSHATCTNLDGAFVCSCNDGWLGNGETCTDEDECALGKHNCHTHATCSNNAGSFSCECNDGYVGDGVSCSDVNECTTGTHNCDSHATCTNLDGAFACSCNDGWFGNGETCSDKDECALGTHNCDTHATCSNNAGSFSCECNDGYVGDGVSCSDVDECATGTHNCDTHATCINLDGAFACSCNDGWIGNGETCSDKDECALGTHNCDTHATCTNNDGSFSCACNDGWTGSGELGTCIDKNECEDATHSCDANASCSNNEGSYDCECNGPEYIGDGYSCELVSQLFMCNLPITALYDGTSIDLTAGVWTDRTGNGNDGSVITGAGGAIYDGLDQANSLYLRDQEIFYGTMATKVSFPMTITPTYTVINLCKYNGATRRRIVQSTTGNIVFGFWGGNRGVAHCDGTGWISEYPGKPLDWVLSMQSYNQYWANGLDYTARPTATSRPAPGKLGLNHGQFPGEASDFACAEIMVINDIRADKNQIQCLEEYFADKYGLDLVAPRDHESAPVSLCGVPITALYDGYGVHLDSHTWVDRSGNANDGVIQGSGGAVFNDLDTSNSLYLNDQPVFYGTRSTNVKFPMTVSPQYTVMNLCKYNGATRSRILQSTTGNIVFGFWAGNRGVAHCDGTGWISKYPGTQPDDWVLSIQSHNQYWANGVDYTARPTATSQPAPGKLGLNYGQFPGEASDFACAEIVVINDVISNYEQIQCFEEYFNEKYGFNIVAPETEQQAPVEICEVAVDALYEPDGIHFDTHSWSDASGNGNEGKLYGSGGAVFNQLDPYNSLYLNDRPVFYGTPATQASFPITLSPQYTVMNLCKYNGATRSRIVQSTTGNIVFGFWAGNRGVAHCDGTGWISEYPGTQPDDWVLSIQSYNQYWANGVDLTARPTATSQPAPGKLGINYGQFPGETSHFACAEILIINQRLTEEKVECFQDYFNDKYALDFQDTPPFYTYIKWDYRIVVGSVGLLILVVVILRFYCSSSRKIKSAGYGVVEGNDSEYASDVPLKDVEDIKA